MIRFEPMISEGKKSTIMKRVIYWIATKHQGEKDEKDLKLKQFWNKMGEKAIMRSNGAIDGLFSMSTSTGRLLKILITFV